MYNINFNDVKFNVNEKKKTVTCYVDNTDICRMVSDFLGDHTKSLDYYFDSPAYKKMTMSRRYYAKATCSEGDTWDEDIGKLIAYNRLKHKIMADFFRHLQDVINTFESDLEDLIVSANDYGKVIGDQIQKRQETIEEKLKGLNNI